MREREKERESFYLVYSYCCSIIASVKAHVIHNNNIYLFLYFSIIIHLCIRGSKMTKKAPNYFLFVCFEGFCLYVCLFVCKLCLSLSH